MNELKRIHVIHEINAGRMTAKQAAQGLGLNKYIGEFIHTTRETKILLRG